MLIELALYGFLWWLTVLFLGDFYSKFFGAKESGPQRQTTLSFSSKAGKKTAKKADSEDVGGEGVDGKDSDDSQHGQFCIQ